MRFSRAGGTTTLGFLLPGGVPNHSLSENIPATVINNERLDHPPVELAVAVRGLYCSDDGLLFDEMVRQLEMLVSSCMPPDSSADNPLQANSLFLILQRDGAIDAWVNELPFRFFARVKRAVERGPARVNDIGDIETVDLSQLHMPEGCGVVAYLSVPGTSNRTLVFDLRPLDIEWAGGDWDPAGLIAAGITHVTFRRQVSISDAQWTALIDQGWFPFMCLDVETVQAMIGAIESGHSIEGDVLRRILANVHSVTPDIRTFFSEHAVYGRHRVLLLQALDAYERGEYALAAAALVGRIEGIIREYVHDKGHQLKRGDQMKQLLDAVAKRSTRNPLSLLQPKRFADYLERIVFASESFNDPTAVKAVTRHSLAHGVVDASAIDEEFAAIALLSLYQSAVMSIDAKPKPQLPGST